MNTESVVTSLRGTAEILRPFTIAPHPGALVWNGSAYVPRSDELFDPFALSWWATLTTAANLLEAQGQPISQKQREYLEQALFGGMGSLNDFMLDVHRLGESARKANELLDHARQQLFAELRGR